MNRRFFMLPLGGMLLFLLGISASYAADRSKEIDWEALNPDIKGATYVNSSEECVECHEDYMRTYALTKMGRNLPSGGCESCHGPGKQYSELSVMQDRPKAISKGLNPGSLSDCNRCHNSSSHAVQPLDAEAAWAHMGH